MFVFRLSLYWLKPIHIFAIVPVLFLTYASSLTQTPLLFEQADILNNGKESEPAEEFIP